MNLSFVTIGDKDFFDSIWISVQQANHFYPSASFYIYDWGLTNSQRTRLKEIVNVDEIIKWDDHVKVSSIERFSLLRRAKSHIYKYLPIEYADPEEIENARQREQNYAQKPFCLLDCLRRSGSRLIYLDGDAFLVNQINDLLQREFDIGVTLRRQDEIINKRNQCQVLNAGVIFFNGYVAHTEAFLKNWIRRIESTYEYLAEQTALTRLIEDECPGIFDNYYNKGVLNLSSFNIKVQVFPCEKYNFNWIEEGVDTDSTNIVHFKGGRHSNVERFHSLLNEIDISIPKR
ncbi:hypothetical protein [Salinibacter ruber]|uniref:Nucleotide-diphospho-sugar transferase domain-containing protein n=1 Tax=Salinibacter ruber TaxID=146919 RepID=A0A9X3A051_9BACT|nr:hypothetical protein [Salinibacter ruber]MCS3613233.1 hypothetical protein [Salinibacter ruber]MCS3616562.1 hypothetical protein [Salinibacter ruber]MCS3675803.1 hypothetical protein [Salinibacter ruber]MCS4037858.1 hypothetical protein [Salinibacter ruber]